MFVEDGAVGADEYGDYYPPADGAEYYSPEDYEYSEEPNTSPAAETTGFSILLMMVKLPYDPFCLSVGCSFIIS